MNDVKLTIRGLHTVPFLSVKTLAMRWHLSIEDGEIEIPASDTVFFTYSLQFSAVSGVDEMGTFGNLKHKRLEY